MDRFDWLELTPVPAEAGGLPAGQVAAPMVRPHDGPSFYRAARRMRQAGHFRAAAEYYGQAVALDEHQHGAWLELIDTLVRARHYADAAERADYALDRFRRVRSLYAARGLVRLHQHKPVPALEDITIALEGQDAAWYGRCIRAEWILHRDVNARAEALRWLEDAADAAPKEWEPYFLGGWMLLDAQLPTLAAAYFGEAAHQHPTAPLNWLCLGDCFRDLRLYEQALFYYQRVLELEPTHELALARQKECSPRLFGLMRGIGQRKLHEKWKANFDRIVKRR